MPNLVARSYLPTIKDLMKQAGAREISAAELIRLRSGANQNRPSNQTIRNFLYRYSLVRQPSACEIVDIITHYYQNAGYNCIEDFNCYIHKFGICMNSILSRSGNVDLGYSNDPYDLIAMQSGWSENVVRSLVKSRLVPSLVATQVMEATISSYPDIATKIGMRVVVAPINDVEYRPVASDDGRKFIIERLATIKVLPTP